jgi:DNA-3-methyladenine glycosylase
MPRASLPRSFYDRPTLDVARELIGKVLVHRSAEGLASGVIVETEAYIGEDDPACHASRGKTPRNAPLYEAPGLAYVYLNYGVHNLFNAVTEAEGRPAAVLIRALEPLDGVDLMVTRRTQAGRVVPVSNLCRGPGNLTRALGIRLDHNRTSLVGGSVTIVDRRQAVGAIRCGSRVGIREGTDRPWRFWVEGHPSVSPFRTGG